MFLIINFLSRIQIIIEMFSAVFFILLLYCFLTLVIYVQMVGICPGWTYRSNFDSCYLMINSSSIGTKTWNQARIACQSAGNASNQNILTSDGQISSTNSNADLLTVTNGIAEEAFVFANFWKKGGTSVG